MVVYLFLTSLISPAVSAADNLSLGLGYPYISIKYDLSALSAEGRFVSGSGVQAYVSRGYWNFHQSDNLKGFTGYEGAVFAGGEYFITENIS